jgi:hypothetical protein
MRAPWNWENKQEKPFLPAKNSDQITFFVLQMRTVVL